MRRDPSILGRSNHRKKKRKRIRKRNEMKWKKGTKFAYPTLPNLGTFLFFFL
jgi:hypothetical protein